MATENTVFIRGTGRCGTITLINQLGLHPELIQVPVNENLPETLIDWSRSTLQIGEMPVSDEAIAESCRAYFAAYCRTSSGLSGTWVQKNTMHAHLLGELLDYWPEARMVYVVRHPLGAIESLVNADVQYFRGGYGYTSTVANSALRWANDLLAYLRSKAFGHPRVLQVRFEDLIADPENVLPRIHEFIGVAPLCQTLSTPPNRYDRRFKLNQTECRWIAESTADITERLGYPPHEEPTGESPNPAESHPERRLRGRPSTLDAVELTRRALAEARAHGYSRVGLLGAGYWARLVCPHLGEVPVEVTCLIDENPALRFSHIGGIQIRSPQAAADSGIDAVIPLTFVHQGEMLRRWREGHNVPAIPLWDEDALSTPTACATA